MKNICWGLVVITLVIGLGACSSSPQAPTPTEPVAVAPQTQEQLIWSTHKERPGWTVSEPEKQDDKLVFIGLSGKFAMEKQSREDAHRDAINKVVMYIGNFARDKYETIRTSYGLSSEIVDSTQAARQFQQQLSEAFTTRVKPKEWYIEKWENAKMQETYYLTYVLATVPESVIEKAFDNALDNQIDDLKKKRDATNEAKAKKQFENAMKAFEDAKKQGFGIDKE